MTIIFCFINCILLVVMLALYPFTERFSGASSNGECSIVKPKSFCSVSISSLYNVKAGHIATTTSTNALVIERLNGRLGDIDKQGSTYYFAMGIYPAA